MTRSLRHTPQVAGAAERKMSPSSVKVGSPDTQQPYEHASYEISINPITDRAELAAQWQLLESQSSSSIFLNWLWVSAWLDSYDTKPLLARVTIGNEPVALGLIALRQEKRRGLIHSRVAYFHQTGLEHEDQIWVEYNGMLAAPGFEVAALDAVLNTLFTQKYCDEVHLSMVPAHCALALCAAQPGAHIEYETRGFQHLLSRCRGAGQTVLESLRANTRHQIRRSFRRYEELYGKPMLSHARSVDEALSFFQEAGQWHRKRWKDSGFNNPAFTGFHEMLIKRAFHHGSVKLSRLAFGKQVIGVFYYTINQKRVFFYLQGVRGEQDSKLKPGLCGHAALMQYFLEQGMDEYDFMGGESQYKQQLSEQENAFMTLRVHNGHWKFRMEEQARRLKRRLFGS